MKNWRSWPLMLLMAGLMVLGTDRLVVHGIYAWAVSAAAYRRMIAELALVGAALAVSLCMIRGPRWRWTAVGAVCALFLWCHGALLPMAAAGIYLAYIGGTGYLLRRYIFRLEVSEGDGYGADILLGASMIIVLFGLMSAAGAGAIPVLRLVAAGSGIVMLLFCGWRYLGGERSGREDCGGERAGRESRGDGLLGRVGSGQARSGRPDWLEGLLLAFILLMLLLQAGRMGISVDHDTLWYSVRSEYMLDNGPKGIYENMGTVSLVYTYPKGWEVLTLPLCDLPSHSFLLAFNLWVTALVLYTAYRIARSYMGPRYARLVPFLLSGIPGIMNMGISGKTDNITLLLQLLLILYMVHFIKDGKGSGLALSLGALLLSWTMKPTAVVFSTAVFGVSVLYLLWMGLAAWRSHHDGVVPVRLKGTAAHPPAWRMWLSLCLPAAALALIWYRTYLFVGVPVTSIFSGIFQKLGCQIRYPFLVWDIPDYGAKPTVAAELMQLLRRLCGVFILPEGGDMSRVLISWCSLSVVFFGLLWVSSLADGWERRQNGGADSRAGREPDGPDRDVSRRLIIYGRSLLVVIGLASVYSIYSLKQVDGNYFILFYTLTVLYGCNVIAGLGRQAGDLGQTKRFRRQMGMLLAMLTVFNGLMLSLSNLAWSVGLTPIDLTAGYPDHEGEAKRAMEEKGNGQIWAILSADPQNRAIAFGEHLEVLAFPCNVQSYTDISSSSGNEALVEDVEAFKTYMAYAGTDYVYVQAGYMAEDYLGFQLLRDCIQAGILTDIQSEQGNILADVDLEGRPGAEADAQLEAFDRAYVVKGGDPG